MNDSRKFAAAITAALAYVASIVAANWAITRWGIVPVGLGLMGPAGVFFVGPTLVLRDYVQWALGKAYALALLTVGLVVSYLIADPHIAFASAAAFATSELVDFALFTWVSPRWSRAVLAGGLVGAVVDSAVFLSIAFGSLAFLQGQVLGKAYGVVIAAVIVAARRRNAAAVPA